MINLFYETQKLTRYQSEEFSYLTNAKVYAYNNLREKILFIQIAKLMKFSTLKSSPCPLTQKIKVHRRALVLLPCLIPCHHCFSATARVQQWLTTKSKKKSHTQVIEKEREKRNGIGRTRRESYSLICMTVCEI